MLYGDGGMLHGDSWIRRDDGVDIGGIGDGNIGDGGKIKIQGEISFVLIRQNVWRRKCIM